MGNHAAGKRQHRSSSRIRPSKVRTTKRWLVGILIFLAGLIAFFALKVGINFWPDGLVHYRPVILACLTYFELFLGLMTPVIITYTKDPRPLSGPGKNPERGDSQ